MTKAMMAKCILALCTIIAAGQTGQTGQTGQAGQAGQAGEGGEAKIIGKVIDGETLTTVAAEIAIAGRDDRNLFLRHARASADGLFEISALPAGELHLTTKMNGYATDHLSVTLARGETRYLEFYLTRGKTVRGTVHDQTDDTPIAGARVRAVSSRAATDTSSIAASYEWESGDTVTDQAGQFEIRDLDPEQEFIVEVSHPQFSAAVTERMRIGRQAKDLSLKLTLGKGLSVNGVVRDANGKILQGARVMLFAENALEARTQSIITNEEGAFRFDQVSPAKKTLVVLHPGYRPYRQAIDFSGQRERLSSIDVVLQPKQ